MYSKDWMTFLLIAVIFLLGTCFGSFVNVVVDRIYKNESILGKGSYCDHCKKKISWFDLIPVVSFFLLAAKCRFCGKKISWQYPIAEFSTGILFVIFALWQLRLTNWQVNPAIIFNLAFYFLMATALMIIFVSDLKYG